MSEFDWNPAKRYEQWTAARKKYGVLTAENWPPLRNGAQPDWPWDEHHIYQLCPHSRRYCIECGTATSPKTYPADQWTEAHREIQAAAQANRAKREVAG